uniref:General transcription factor IIH subunit n=1 Tax=Panagrolaimus sp. JU765 TaxID=591449 RepID=A0AC34QCV4_9BILA
MDLDERQVGYKWESSYAEGLNIQEAFAEDEKGSVEKAIANLVEEAKRRQREKERPAKKRIGVLRYVFLVVDNSAAITEKTLEPDRLRCTQKALKTFVRNFFRENPLSQLGIIVVKDKVSEIQTPLTASVKDLEEGIDALNIFECKGDFSLQNGVLRAYHNLQGLPMHAHREVIVIMSAMTSNLKRNQIIVHGIHLACELYVLRKFCAKTRGSHFVVLNDVHYDVVLNELVIPPKEHLFAKQSRIETFYRMGFPKKERIVDPIFCACHKDDFKEVPETDEPVDLSGFLRPFGFFCVQCKTRVCSLPIDCPNCGLRLVSATQIAKAQMHILPLPIYAEKPSSKDSRCFSCNFKFGPNSKCYECKICHEIFCDECDASNHQAMICPGCPESHIPDTRINDGFHENGLTNGYQYSNGR